MKKNTLGSLTFLRISRFANQSNQLSNQYLKQFDLSAAKFDTMVQIEQFQPIPQQELAKKVTVSQSGMSKMLDRLEKEGYIYRSIDWKVKHVSLTTKGQEKLDGVYEKQLNFQTQLFDDRLSKEEQKELYKLMTRLQNHTNKQLK
ncbi:MarR family transcriptional regulator [Vagococcus carniphilus]|uniref:MarR family transcriptional regulator n=1 Tax=Vagococcus carniphilus TaxID=218144 RepID=A0AAW8U4S6_9ENTE|nr:MarR family transcriptional regulator [Vagococcus carniphilus]MDT2834566.1 MarR family transcriptional regulator [Vagococcus carniphilus]